VQRETPPIDPEEVTARLRSTLSSPSYEPPVLPAAAVEILQLAQRPEVGFEQVTPALERDPVLTARVVSVAQSAPTPPARPSTRSTRRRFAWG
jgi:HD-like signal output (HDOD) protein